MNLSIYKPTYVVLKKAPSVVATSIIDEIKELIKTRNMAHFPKVQAVVLVKSSSK